MVRNGSWRWLAVAAVLVPLQGCYVYRYTPVTPVPGSYVALDLNDAGRAQLANRVGDGILTVEGDLTQSSESSYVLKIQKTVGIRGELMKWAGEPMEVSRQYVGVVRERQLSVGRTAAFVGSIAIATGYFIVSRGLFGFGGSGPNGEPPGTGEQ